MDGTGELFAEFAKELSANFEIQVISYPKSERKNHTELVQLIASKTQDSGPYMLLAESFSWPFPVSTPRPFPVIIWPCS